MTAAGTAPASAGKKGDGLMKSKNSKPEEIRSSNIQAAKALSDAIRTSLGPRGMDKMIQDAKGEVTITNDGATILNQMKVVHPAARMLVELSKAQDIEAGDGTTSVCVMAGSLLDAADKLLKKGIHPTSISDSFQKAAAKSVEILTAMSTPVDLTDKESLLKASNTSLNSKVVSQNSAELSPIAVDAVLKIIDPAKENNVNLKDIKIIKKIGGTVDDTELVDGMVFEQKAANVNGPKKIEKAKIGFIQFCVSPPKTDMDNQVVVSDYAAMDRVLREERAYLLNIVKQIKKAGCNVLLIQKSILRDALSDLATHFFDKMKIMVVKDIEREDVEFLCKTLGCRPIASLDHFTAENLVSAEMVEEVQTGSSKCVKITGMATPGKTCSIIIRGSNKLMLEEADRSIHDALCVIRCLVKKRFLIAGGGAPETEVSRELMLHANTLTGADAYCFKAFAEALEIIPYTLAENAVLIQKSILRDALVSTSAITLASETVRSILKIDDIVNTIR